MAKKAKKEEKKGCGLPIYARINGRLYGPEETEAANKAFKEMWDKKNGLLPKHEAI